MLYLLNGDYNPEPLSQAPDWLDPVYISIMGGLGFGLRVYMV